MPISDSLEAPQRWLGEWLDKRGMPVTVSAVVSTALGVLIWWQLSSLSADRKATAAANQARIVLLEAKIDTLYTWRLEALTKLVEACNASHKHVADRLEELERRIGRDP